MGKIVEEFFDKYKDIEKVSIKETPESVIIREELENAYAFIEASGKIKNSRDRTMLENGLKRLTTIAIIRQYENSISKRDIQAMHLGKKPFPENVKEAIIQVLQNNPKQFKTMKTKIFIDDVNRELEILKFFIS